MSQASVPNIAHSVRKDIRLAVVAALSNEGVPAFPTRAGAHVYDSRADDLNFAVGQENTGPTIVVYTDSTKYSPMQLKAKGGPFVVSIDVIIEISLSHRNLDQETSATMEADLDDFEGEVLAALFDPYSTTSRAIDFMSMITAVSEIESMRLSNQDQAIRSSMRDLIFTVQVSTGCKPLGEAFPTLQRLGMAAKVGDADAISSLDDSSCA